MLHSDPADRRRLITLWSLINWWQAEDGTNTVPDELATTLDQGRWSMLINALIDWDIICSNHEEDQHDATYRLGAVYTLPTFEAVTPATGSGAGRVDQSVRRNAGRSRGDRGDRAAVA